MADANSHVPIHASFLARPQEMALPTVYGGDTIFWPTKYICSTYKQSCVKPVCGLAERSYMVKYINPTYLASAEHLYPADRQNLMFMKQDQEWVPGYTAALYAESDLRQNVHTKKLASAVCYSAMANLVVMDSVVSLIYEMINTVGKRTDATLSEDLINMSHLFAIVLLDISVRHHHGKTYSTRCLEPEVPAITTSGEYLCSLVSKIYTGKVNLASLVTSMPLKAFSKMDVTSLEVFLYCLKMLGLCRTACLLLLLVEHFKRTQRHEIMAAAYHVTGMFNAFYSMRDDALPCLEPDRLVELVGQIGAADARPGLLVDSCILSINHLTAQQIELNMQRLFSIGIYLTLPTCLFYRPDRDMNRQVPKKMDRVLAVFPCLFPTTSPMYPANYDHKPYGFLQTQHLIENCDCPGHTKIMAEPGNCEFMQPSRRHRGNMGRRQEQ
ncbi:ORF33 [Ranid herpesvirus 2]|uniref:ORF33 n=1 Tax=Ranid herpesvirus 2 TaxID=389214 RepID=Q14W73_9VIRU|nr:ORF33 [Ranid herpesvirus 2]ABG25607.1 ORF33 [Ranid herpesvirus 2]